MTKYYETISSVMPAVTARLRLHVEYESAKGRHRLLAKGLHPLSSGTVAPLVVSGYPQLQAVVGVVYTQELRANLATCSGEARMLVLMPACIEPCAIGELELVDAITKLRWEAKEARFGS